MIRVSPRLCICARNARGVYFGIASIYARDLSSPSCTTARARSVDPKVARRHYSADFMQINSRQDSKFNEVPVNPTGLMIPRFDHYASGG